MTSTRSKPPWTITRYDVYPKQECLYCHPYGLFISCTHTHTHTHTLLSFCCFFLLLLLLLLLIISTQHFYFIFSYVFLYQRFLMFVKQSLKLFFFRAHSHTVAFSPRSLRRNRLKTLSSRTRWSCTCNHLCSRCITACSIPMLD